jgi:hypothetical protein
MSDDIITNSIMNSYTDIRSGVLETIWSNDGWVLGPFKHNLSFLNTENVYMRWCKWGAGETRNQTKLGRSYDWCEAIFLISGEIRVKYQADSVLLGNEGDYAVYDSVRHPKYQVLRDSTAIVLRWKSNFEGRVYNNIDNHLEDNRQWVIGSFVDKIKNEHFYSENFELKWGLKTKTPYKNSAKIGEPITNYNWKTMGVLCRGTMIYEFATEKAYLGKCGHYAYWNPNVPHTNSTDRPSLLLTLRWK